MPRLRLLLGTSFALLTVACAAGSPRGGRGAASDAPNVVIVFTDDQGWADVGVQGAEGFETPHLDRLAAEGTRFTSFYVAQPVCSASRTALLTGCYPNRIGISGALGPGAKHGIHRDETTLGELFQGRGYATACYGKWHLGHQPEFLPTRHGFDEYYGLPYSNDMWPFHPEWSEGYPPLPLIEGEEVIGTNPDQSLLTRSLTARAVDFIERSTAADRPFFLYLAHPMPHVPLFTGPDHTGVAATRFGDVIEEIDWSTGEVMTALERAGVADDTLVIFTSDNGPWLSYGDHAGSAGPLREGKQTTFEGGVRVPCIARWPGRVAAGAVCETPWMTIDLLPTLAATVGAPLPARRIDGVDASDVLYGGDAFDEHGPHEALFFYYRKNHLEAVRSGRWKLHLDHGYRRIEGLPRGKGGRPTKYDDGARIGLSLFNLWEDPGERRDVAEANPAVVARLLEHAEAIRADLGDALTEREATGARAPGRVE